MNTPIRLFTGLVLAAGLIAPLPAQEEPLPPPPDAELDDSYPASSPDELDALLGPIALYPDDLVSLILPAATETTDIVLAARYLDNGGSVDRADEQPWDDSVKAIAHFPEVVTMLNEDLAWTQQVGDEFLLQPAEVMKSIQRLRAKAYAAGTLRDTPQQKVLIDGSVIRIVPAVENVVYVPRYNTEVVYVDSPVYYREPYITFGTGWYIGSWHRWDCDWYNHRVWVFYSHNSWRDHRYHYRHRNYSHRDHDHRHGRAWNPPPRRNHPGSPGYNHRRDNDRNDRRHAGPDRNRDYRNPGSRSARPSSPTDVVTRDVIANQRNNGRNPEARDDRNRNSNRNRNDADSTRTPGTYRPRDASAPARTPATSTARTTVVAPSRPTTRSQSESTRPHITRSREDSNRDRSSNRNEQARSPERRSPTSVVANSVRNSSSARTSESRSTTSTSRVTAARSETTRATGSGNSNASSGRNQGGSQRSSNSNSSSDSGRSRGSSRGDDNNNNSSSNSGRSGRGR